MRRDQRNEAIPFRILRSLSDAVSSVVPFVVLSSFLYAARTCSAWTTPFVPSASHHRGRWASSSSTVLSAASWRSHASTDSYAPTALAEVLKRFEQDGVVLDRDVDLAFLFVSRVHSKFFSSLVATASERLGGGGGGAKNVTLVSVLTGGVVGDGTETDDPTKPCLSLLAGGLSPDARVETATWGTGEEPPSLSETRSWLLLADPYADVERATSSLERGAGDDDDDDNDEGGGGGNVVAGGLSCPDNDGGPSLGLGATVLPQGSVVRLGLGGALGMRTMVAQGCRPVGEQEFTVTAVLSGNVVTELNDKPATEVLRDFVAAAPEADRRLMNAGGILCGVAKQRRGGDGPPRGGGDYLCRQIMGLIPSAGGVAVGAVLEVGDRLRFQVRDGETAAKDLDLMVERTRTARAVEAAAGRNERPAAVLQISCVGRGRSLFGRPNVDVTGLRRLVARDDDDDDDDTQKEDEVPIGGFFANGEIGPVGVASPEFPGDGRIHSHGFTTVAVVLYERDVNDKGNVASAVLEEEGVVRGSDVEGGTMDAWG